ncbi:hypothetical protein PCE1_001985 [Barthelona sp. PCE]
MPRHVDRGNIVYNGNSAILTVDNRTISVISTDQLSTSNCGTYRCSSSIKHGKKSEICGKCIHNSNLFYSFYIQLDEKETTTLMIVFWFITAGGQHDVSSVTKIDIPSDSDIDTSAPTNDYLLFCYSPEVFFLMKKNTLEIVFAMNDGIQVEIQLDDFELLTQTTFSSSKPIFSYESGGMFGGPPEYKYLDSDLQLKEINNGFDGKIDQFINVLNSNCLLHVTMDVGESNSFDSFVLCNGKDFINLFEEYTLLKSVLETAIENNKYRPYGQKFDFGSCSNMIIYEVSDEVFEFSLIFKNILWYSRIGVDGTVETDEFKTNLSGKTLFLLQYADTFGRMLDSCYKCLIPEIMSVEYHTHNTIILKKYILTTRESILEDFSLKMGSCRIISSNQIIFSTSKHDESVLNGAVLFDLHKQKYIIMKSSNFIHLACDPIINDQFFLFPTYSIDEQEEKIITTNIFIHSWQNPVCKKVNSIPNLVMAQNNDESTGLFACLTSKPSAENGMLYLFNNNAELLDTIEIPNYSNSKDLWMANNYVMVKSRKSIALCHISDNNKLNLLFNHDNSPFICFNPSTNELWGTIGGVTRAYPLNNSCFSIDDVSFPIINLECFDEKTNNVLEFCSDNFLRDQRGSDVYYFNSLNNSIEKFLNLSEIGKPTPSLRYHSHNSFKEQLLVIVRTYVDAFACTTVKFVPDEMRFDLVFNEYKFDHVLRSFSHQIVEPEV